MWTVPGLFRQSLAAQRSFVDGSEGVRENIHWKMLCGNGIVAQRSSTEEEVQEQRVWSQD